MKKRSEVQSNVITYHSLHADLLSVQKVIVININSNKTNPLNLLTFKKRSEVKYTAHL